MLVFFSSFIIFYNRAPVGHEAVCVSFQFIEARNAIPLVPTKAKNLLTASPPTSYLLCSDQAVSVSEWVCECVFGRCDIHPLFSRTSPCSGPVMTPAGRWQLRPGCTDPKESGLAGRITRQSCNKALSSGLGTNRCTAGLPSQQAPISPRTQSLCHMDASLSPGNKSLFDERWPVAWMGMKA